MILDNIDNLINITEGWIWDSVKGVMKFVKSHPLQTVGLLGTGGAIGVGAVGGNIYGKLTASPEQIPVNNMIPSGLPTLVGGAALGAGTLYGLHQYHKSKTKNEI